MPTTNIVVGNTYTFENLHTGKFLNLYAGNTTNGTNVCQYTADESNEQKWTFRSDDKLYTNTSTTKCLDKYTVSGDAKDRNADIWTNNDNINQRVEFETSGNYVKIHLIGTNYYLTASAGSSNGANTAARKEPGAAGNVFWAVSSVDNDEVYSLNQQKWIARLDSEGTSGGEVTGQYVINNKPIPKVGCEEGKYWTTDGTPNGNSLYHNGSECAGFARYIYNYLWGSDTYGTAITYRNLTGDEEVDFAGINIGARINCDKVDGTGNHSMVVVGKTGTDITVYHANWATAANYCIIKFTTWTYEEFANIFTNIKATSYTP